MTAATIKTTFDSYAEIAIAAHEDGKRVEFEETTARGGVVYLTAKISVRSELPEVPTGGK